MAHCAQAELSRLENIVVMAPLDQPHGSPAPQTRKASACSVINLLCDLWQVTSHFLGLCFPHLLNLENGDTIVY